MLKVAKTKYKMVQHFPTYIVKPQEFYNPFKDYKRFNEEDQSLSLKELFERNVSEEPTRVALECEEGDYTYGELNKLINPLAHKILDELGDGPGSVNVWVEGAMPQVVSILACWKSGKSITANDNSEPIEYNRSIITTSRPDLIITQNSCFENVRLSSPENTRILLWEDLDFSSNLENPQIEVPHDRILEVIYTSGSTGLPKGVLISQRTCVFQSTMAANNTGYGPEDKQLHVSPFCHTNGPGLLRGAISVGSTLSFYPLKARGIEGLAKWIESKKITRVSLVPTVFRYLFGNLDTPPDLSSVKLLHLGGEQVRPDDVELYRKHLPDSCSLLVNIGSTEAQAFCRYYITKNTRIGESVPLGQSWPGKRLLFWDENNNDIPKGKPGTIVVESEYLADGYKDLPELTNRTFLEVPGKPGLRRYITGDLGKLDENGNLIFLGRGDQQIKIYGHRVEIGFIESQLLQHPDIHATAIRTWPDQQRGHHLAAYYVPAEGCQPQSASLRDWLSERIPYYMVPGSFTALTELPLTVSHKIDRKQLPRPIVEENTFKLPTNNTEKRIHAIWMSLFQLEQISCDDDFFGIGGNSLIAMQSISRLQDQFNIPLAPDLLFRASTIRDLAKLIHEDMLTSGNIVPLQEKGTQHPVFMIHGWAGSIFHFGRLARKLGADYPVFGVQDNKESDGSPRLTSIEALGKQYAELIMQQQGEEPCSLMGYSLGGMIALETARVIQSEGGKIDQLFIIDSTPKNLPRSIRNRMILPYLYSRFRTHTASLVKGRNKPSLSFFANRWEAFLKVAGFKKSEVLSIGLQDEEIEVPDDGDYYQIISRGYQSRPVDIPVTLLISNHTRSDLQKAWAYLSNDQLSTYTIPGQHHDVLNEENINDFVRIFRQALADSSESRKRED